MPIDQIDTASLPEAPSKPPTPENKTRKAKKKSDGRLSKNRKPRTPDIRWVAMYLEADPDKTPAAPTLIAGSMLSWARRDEKNRARFWATIYPRLLAAEDKAASVEQKMRDSGEKLTLMFEALERERPDLAALSRKRIYGNTSNGKCRCPNCGTTFKLGGGPGESPGPGIGRIGAAESAEIPH